MTFESESAKLALLKQQAALDLARIGEGMELTGACCFAFRLHWVGSRCSILEHVGHELENRAIRGAAGTSRCAKLSDSQNAQDVRGSLSLDRCERARGFEPEERLQCQGIRRKYDVPHDRYFLGTGPAKAQTQEVFLLALHARWRAGSVDIARLKRHAQGSVCGETLLKRRSSWAPMRAHQLGCGVARGAVFTATQTWVSDSRRRAAQVLDSLMYVLPLSVLVSEAGPRPHATRHG